MKVSRAFATTWNHLRTHEFFWAGWAVAAAFGSYFCMYAFRKPFTAAAYADASLWGIGFKTILVTAQVLGYMVSKFIGIKIIAEMPPQRRAFSLLGFVLLAEVALLLFGLVPRPWNALCLFLNGLPLGMVFGLVLGFLEGRRLTEALTAGLCASFILADGVTKSVGTWLLNHDIPEDWMPSVAGALFLLPLGLCVAMLAQIPPPTHRDTHARAERSTMNRADRWALLRCYAWGLVPIIVIYLVVTILRSIRADFAPELWRGLGTAINPSTYSHSEMFVAFGVLAVNGSAVFIRDNRYAFFTSLGTCGLGVGLLAVALVAQQTEVVDGFTFMVLLGLGLYLPYVAIHTTVFERLLAMTRARGNIGFLMYVADSIGYLGYVIVMLVRNFGSTSDDFVGLVTHLCWAAIGLATLSLVQACWYFHRNIPRPSPT
jgi:hypothetical protein